MPTTNLVLELTTNYQESCRGKSVLKRWGSHNCKRMIVVELERLLFSNLQCVESVKRFV